jgi:hypothetical protein
MNLCQEELPLPLLLIHGLKIALEMKNNANYFHSVDIKLQLILDYVLQ